MISTEHENQVTGVMGIIRWFRLEISPHHDIQGLLHYAPSFTAEDLAGKVEKNEISLEIHIFHLQVIHCQCNPEMTEVSRDISPDNIVFLGFSQIAVNTQKGV